MPERTDKYAAGVADDSLESATWLDRAYAAAIDGLIILLLTVPVMVLLVAAGISNPPRYNGGPSAEFFFYLALVSTLWVLLYPTIWLARNAGQTVGKRIMRVRVVRNRDGALPTLGRAALRELVAKQLLFGMAAVLTFGTVQIADVLWPFVDKRNRALHDLVAGTRVVVA